MNLRLRAALCVAAASFLVKTAAAQACPAPFAANPLALINGQTWAFQTEDALDATIGIFTASVVPSRNGGPNVGVLNITESFNASGDIQEQLNIGGSIEINPDCSGGLLSFASSTNGFQYQFVFADNFTKMYLVNASTSTANNRGNGLIVGDRGTAVLLPAAPSCSGVAQPLSLFSGTWSFKVEDVASGTVGLINAGFGLTPRSNGVIVGGFAGNESTVNIGVPFVVSGNQSVQAPVAGPYNINSDCSGGHLFLSTPAASQYAFVFAGPNQIYLLGVSGLSTARVISGTTIPRASFGVADRF